MKTPAIVFVRNGEARLREIEMPDPGKEEVRIQTCFSTISVGTERWALKNLFTWSSTPFPCVPGYQRVGIITAIGSGVKGWNAGDRVIATTGCWEGKVKPFWGAHVMHANTHSNELYRIPGDVDDIDASAVVVAQVGYNAAFRPVVKKGDWVLVYGDGIIGQCAAQSARALGAKVIMIGHRGLRIELAEKYSAEFALNNQKKKVKKTVMEITNGVCPTVVLDTVQTEECQQEYIDLLEYARGQIVYSGFTPGNTWANMALLQQKELTTHFVAGWTRERIKKTLALMSEGKLTVRPLVTHLVPYEQGPEMYSMILNKNKPFLGITLDWTGGKP